MLALSGIRAYEVNMDGIVKSYLEARQVIEVFVYDGTIDDAFAHGRTQAWSEQLRLFQALAGGMHSVCREAWRGVALVACPLHRWMGTFSITSS